MSVESMSTRVWMGRWLSEQGSSWPEEGGGIWILASVFGSRTAVCISVSSRMQLPNAENALVDRKKVTQYLLSTEHPDGRSQSRFFGSLGFSVDEPDRMIWALLRMAVNAEVVEVVVTPFGRKYIVDGVLETPIGWAVNIRSVWIVRKLETVPHLVTAYPR